jgi:hypothetical protein
MPLVLNWYAGWSLILAGFLSGAIIGLWFHREDFLGGYQDWRRRLLRLGHIAMVALGFLNVVYSQSAADHALAGHLLIAGGIAMPTVCVLSAWRKPLKVLFPLPVVMLVAAVVLILLNPLIAS